MKTMKIAHVALACVLAVGFAGCNVFRGESTAGEYVDDVAITTQVKYELLESKKVDGLDVNVDVMNGRVKLTGWASGQAEKAKAGQLAGAVKGVKSVDNQLKIKG
ncbi:MAG: BON domain-containing protein [Steroidobacteraceae bacterium]